ncbi:hypothetical protein CERSUDRAFT_74374 [Gelatoporia subvermispora B]|uniref:Uncharacterized protein n=1 Tax=Ceriporiopsis subvermispora (strain B) TaxID=914234 RepID=M2PJM1_CERS8|nr:hypothetical protein CERSUDRAFT_74374 [Gelatoporia subvermispora B]
MARGRKPKYHTNAERKAARKERKEVYKKTERARTLRQCQNRRAYIRRMAHRKSPFMNWSPPSLPRALLDMARQYIVVKESDDLDDLPCLGIWHSPYEICLPPRDVMDAFKDDKYIVEKMNFKFWGDMVEAGLERLRVAREDGAQLEVKIEAEVAERLFRWITDWSHKEHITANKLWDLAMSWNARIIAVLYKDLESCRKGVDYCSAYEKRVLAWQNLNWVRFAFLER